MQKPLPGHGAPRTRGHGNGRGFRGYRCRKACSIHTISNTDLYGGVVLAALLLLTRLSLVGGFT
jgi:hypothetical protein